MHRHGNVPFHGLQVIRFKGTKRGAQLVVKEVQVKFNRMFPYLFLAVIAALLLTLIRIEFAEPKSPAIGSSAPDPSILRVYMSGNYLPLHGVRGAQRIGIEAEIAEALASAMGKRVKYFARKRLGKAGIDAVATGMVDVALNAITPTKERGELVDFTEPIVRIPLLIASRKGGIHSLQDLKGKRIAVRRGPLVSQLADHKLNLVLYDTAQQAMNSSISGLTDAVIAEEPALMDIDDVSRLTISDFRLGGSPIAVAVPKGKKAEYDAILARLADTIPTIRAKWESFWAEKLTKFRGVSVGRKTACAVTAKNTLVCFGEQQELLTPPPGKFIGLTMGADHACAIREDHTVTCWGKNDYGQATPKPGTFKRVTAGVDHTCGLMQDGTLTCWGKNTQGQAEAPPGTYRTMGVGDGFSCALGNDGHVMCWGRRLGVDPNKVFSALAVGPMGVCAAEPRRVKNRGVKQPITCWVTGKKSRVDMEHALSNLTVGFDIACGWDRWRNRVTCIGPDIGYIPDKGRMKSFDQIEAGQGMACGVWRSFENRDLSYGPLECWGRFSSDPQLMTTSDGAVRYMSKASRSRSPEVVALCRGSKWRKIGLLHHDRGAIELYESNYDDKNATWYACSRKGPQTVDINAPCRQDNLIAATIPLSERKVDVAKNNTGSATVYQELAACDISGLPGSLSLYQYEYDPIKAGYTQEEIDGREGLEIGTGALRYCSGLVLTWDDSPGEMKDLDIDGCISGD